MSKVEYKYLRELCTVNQGLQIPIERRFKENGPNRYFYITVQFLKESYVEKYYVENPPPSSVCKIDDIIVVRTGSTGQVLTGVTGCFHNNFFRVNYDRSLLNHKYLYYCLSSKEKQKEMLVRSGLTTIPDLNHFMFLDIKIPTPKLKSQRKIAFVLSSLDDKIKLNNKINAELEAMAKTLYDYWFVQFDFPNVEGKPYKAYSGKMIYNEQLKREIPEGWEVKRLGKVLKTYIGGTPSTKNKNFWDGDIPWMNSGEVANFPLLSTEQKITQDAVNNTTTRFLKKGSVILSITRHLRVSILGIDACINQSIAGIKEDDNFKNAYIYFAVFNDINRLMSLRTGAQQPHINKGIVDNSLFIIPGMDILKTYYSIAVPIIDKIIINSKQNQELASLRDWLLPMLMNGQVTVAGAYKEVEEIGIGGEGESEI